MHRLFHIFLWMVAIGLCGSCNQTTEAVVDDDSTALRLGVLPTMECLPFYYADSVGLFDSLGLSVRLVTFDAAMDADTALMNGSVDGMVSDWVKACLWNEKGDRFCQVKDTLQIVMSGELNLWLITSKNARLLKAESLKEKIIGITRHSAADYLTDKMLTSVKLQSIDLNKPQINNLRLRTLMVDQNQLDGAIMPEPYASEAVARGAKRLNNLRALNAGNLMCVVFPYATYQARKSEIDKIRQVYDRAVVALNKDTLSRVLEFFPPQHRMYLPDTLFTYTPLALSTPPNDSIRQDIRQWAKGRGLIK